MTLSTPARGRVGYLDRGKDRLRSRGGFVAPVAARQVDDHRVSQSSRRLLARTASATGFRSAHSLALRSGIAVTVETLLERFVWWPSAAVAFDVAIAVAAWAIIILLSSFILASRSR
jgi:hypothetical protein